MTDLEKEIKQLKEKIKLLEKVKELEELIAKYPKPDPVYIPYPIYPCPNKPYWEPYVYPYTTTTITWDGDSFGGAETTGVWNVPTVWTDLDKIPRSTAS